MIIDVSPGLLWPEIIWDKKDYLSIHFDTPDCPTFHEVFIVVDDWEYGLMDCRDAEKHKWHKHLDAAIELAPMDAWSEAYDRDRYD